MSAAGDVTEETKAAMTDVLRQYDPGEPGAEATEAWDQVMEELECCGVNGFADWAENNANYGNCSDNESRELRRADIHN